MTDRGTVFPAPAVHLTNCTLVALTKVALPGRMKKPHSLSLRQQRSLVPRTRARVAELADALASGASDRKVVEVRVLSRAPNSPSELAAQAGQTTWSSEKLF